MDFLDKIPLDQTALTIAMVAIVLAFALVSIIKGIIKTIVMLISLTIAAAAFLFGFLQSPPYIEQFIPEAAGWMPLLAGGLCALMALVLIQLFLGVISGKSKPKKKQKPASDSGGESKGGKTSRNPLAPIFGLFLGVVALYGAMTALRYFGTAAELEHLQTYVNEGAEKAGETPLIVQAKQWLDDSPIATWQEKIDLLNTSDYRARLNLAKLIIISGDKADLAKALQTEENKEVFKIPEINAVTLTGDDLRKLCKDYDFQALFEDERFQRLTKKPSTRRELLKVKLSEFLGEEK
ncbi:hypothetical protein [Roseibacillus persicicus]|uniref:CvpA family protein n=1 Tax=Roseibacillus persicicus TaxID=454148 RepID=A0A918TR11_9BACT|nr:hypothetical protein [Roseibacillus persicicus]MDQ8191911.1 hypothetical protein [Roseibacillus persicicus]GHC58262.1 hypothetical protein GCM10007100_26490 [Roseibacillus persicicus]